MVTTNKKFISELKNIIASTDKAKKVALAEIDKIDAKYKALAEKEKASLSKTVKLLESQLSMYNDMIKTDDESAEPEETTPNAAEQIPEKEQLIEDTVFPENNETVFDTEESSADDTQKTETTDDVEDTESVEWPDDTSTEDTVAPSEPETNDSENTEESEDESEDKSEDEWPEFPEEWK